jgi:hypothetical protein
MNVHKESASNMARNKIESTIGIKTIDIKKDFRKNTVGL